MQYTAPPELCSQSLLYYGNDSDVNPTHGCHRRLPYVVGLTVSAIVGVVFLYLTPSLSSTNLHTSSTLSTLRVKSSSGLVPTARGEPLRTHFTNVEGDRTKTYPSIRAPSAAFVAHVATPIPTWAAEGPSGMQTSASMPLIGGVIVLGALIAWAVSSTFKYGSKDAAIKIDGPPVDTLDNDERAKVAKEVFATDKRPVILYDGVCNLCNGAVNFTLDFDDVGKFRFAALQSVIGRSLLYRCGRSVDDISTIVLVGEDGFYDKSEAVLRILRDMPKGPWSKVARFGLIFPLPLRNSIYDWVSANRYDMFGEYNACRLSHYGFEDRFVPEPESNTSTA
uniref:DUF393 domain-containing protein n=1 Tax=Eutreptiella gymnastica TaxID=73025 RepID=A0A7S1JEJ6_9EUGL